MLLKTVFSRKPRYTRPQWQTKNSVAAAAAALSHGSEEKVHEDKAWMSWSQKPATNRNAQYFSMNQPTSRWRVPQLHGPNTSLYKTSANSRDTESFTAALSLSQNTCHLLYTSKYGAAASSSSYPRNAEERKPSRTAAARRATGLDGVRARTSQDQKKKLHITSRTTENGWRGRECREGEKACEDVEAERMTMD